MVLKLKKNRLGKIAKPSGIYVYNHLSKLIQFCNVKETNKRITIYKLQNENNLSNKKNQRG